MAASNLGQAVEGLFAALSGSSSESNAFRPPYVFAAL
jgi:hypothetical protein